MRGHVHHFATRSPRDVSLNDTDLVEQAQRFQCHQHALQLRLGSGVETGRYQASANMGSLESDNAWRLSS